MVQFDAGGSFPTVIYVLDANGNKVLDQTVTSLGKYVISVNHVNTLLPGMYIVRVVSQGVQHAVKWVNSIKIKCKCVYHIAVSFRGSYFFILIES
jgi:hypothetical protein